MYLTSVLWTAHCHIQYYKEVYMPRYIVHISWNPISVNRMSWTLFNNLSWYSLWKYKSQDMIVCLNSTNTKLIITSIIRLCWSSSSSWKAGAGVHQGSLDEIVGFFFAFLCMKSRLARISEMHWTCKWRYFEISNASAASNANKTRASMSQLSSFSFGIDIFIWFDT